MEAELRRLMASAMAELMASAMAKLKAGMDEGPDGDSVVLTPAEATLIYRLLNRE
jgi:hypothetical protein